MPTPTPIYPPQVRYGLKSTGNQLLEALAHCRACLGPAL